MRGSMRIRTRSRPSATAALVLGLSGFSCDPADALRQVTTVPHYALEPDWSSDGSEIAFVQWDSAGGATDVRLVSASGGLPVPLEDGVGMEPAWSPSGQYIATSGASIGGRSTIFLVSISEGRRYGLVGGAGDYRHPTWSPDGEWIAFSRNYNVSEVAVVPSTGGHVEWIISDASSPAWSPDSTMIAFTRWNLWVASSTGENQRQLTDFPGGAESPCWSPDSRYIAFDSNHSGNQDIWIVPVSGGEPIQLTTDPGWDSDPTWSPRGDEIAFSSTRAAGTGADIWVIEVDLTPVRSTGWGQLKSLLGK